MDIREEYAKKYGVKEVTNMMGEVRKTRKNNIVFPNGWVASIVQNTQYPEKGKYSVGIFDYNGYFYTDILDQYGADKDYGVFFCNTDLEIIIACETIRRLRIC